MKGGLDAVALEEALAMAPSSGIAGSPAGVPAPAWNEQAWARAERLASRGVTRAEFSRFALRWGEGGETRHRLAAPHDVRFPGSLLAAIVCALRGGGVRVGALPGACQRCARGSRVYREGSMR